MAELMEYLQQAVAHQASDLFVVAGGPVSEKLEGRIQPISEEKAFPQASRSGSSTSSTRAFMLSRTR